MKIIFVHESNLEALPPLLSVISVLAEEFEIEVITGVRNPPVIEQMWCRSRVTFHFVDEQWEDLPNGWCCLWKKTKRFFHIGVGLRKLIRERTSQNKASLYWIGSLGTALYLKKLLRSKSYIAHIFELSENSPCSRFFLKDFYQNACEVVVPEINRAYLLRVWLGLKKLPFVLPNKPRIEKQEKVRQLGIKSIVYQGVFDPQERELSGFCEAIDALYPDFEFVLIGKKNAYLEELEKKYKSVRYGGYFVPPTHISETRKAYIGVATYSDRLLNTIFCAPNKIWEYSACGVPMLINSVPGLTSVLAGRGCALVIDENDAGSIREGIKKIDENYEFFSASAYSFFEEEYWDSKVKSLIDVAEINKEPRLENSLDTYWVAQGILIRGLVERIRKIVRQVPFLGIFVES